MPKHKDKREKQRNSARIARARVMANISPEELAELVSRMNDKEVRKFFKLIKRYGLRW